MSGQHEGAPVDPLAALRAADHRPRIEVWRERLAEGFVHQLRSIAARGALAGAFALIAVAIVWRLYVTSEPPVEASIPLAQPTQDSSLPAAGVVDLPTTAPINAIDDEQISEQIVVHVAGAVRTPGLVTGETGWRVDDALRAAGGATAKSDLDRLNLAQLVNDGERIFVPEVGEDEPVVLGPAGTSTTGTSSEQGPININTANAPALETLPGIGPATAAAILTHRDQHGSFGTVDAIVAVRGIGPATLEALRDHVSVG